MLTNFAHKLNVIGEGLCLIFYTFDLDVICTALEAASKRGVKVRILGDKVQTTKSKGTQALMARLKTTRIEPRLTNGVALSDHYTSGTSAQSGIVQSRNGIVHSKFLLSDRQLILGSTNFTTSSQCNLETSCHIRLSERGYQEVERFFSAAYQEAEPY